jgi:ketosteroid isomerase-like protein
MQWIRAAVLAAGVAVVIAACQRPSAGRDGDAAEAVRAADAAWLKAFTDRDLEGVVTAVEPSGRILPPNAPIVTGQEGARAMVSEMFAMPGLSFSWDVTRVEVAESADLGYTAGTYDMTFNDAQGNPVADRGKFVTVWRRQADGSWKVVEDVFNSDLPAAGS